MSNNKAKKLFELGIQFEFLFGEEIASLFSDHIHFLRLMDVFVYYLYYFGLNKKKEVYLIVMAVGVAMLEIVDFKDVQTISELKFLLKNKIWNLEELMEKTKHYYMQACTFVQGHRKLEDKDYTNYYDQVSKQLGSIQDFIYSSRNGINHDQINKAIKTLKYDKRIENIDIYIHKLNIFCERMDQYVVYVKYANIEDEGQAKTHLNYDYQQEHNVVIICVKVNDLVIMQLNVNLIELECNSIFKLIKKFKLLENVPEYNK